MMEQKEKDEEQEDMINDFLCTLPSSQIVELKDITRLIENEKNAMTK